MTDCRAAGDDEFVLAVETPNSRGECRAGRAFARGDDILIVVRPEDAVLAPPGASSVDGRLAWQGTIVDGVFRGPRRTLTIETAGSRLNVECPATRGLRIGEKVTVAVDAANAWAIGRG